MRLLFILAFTAGFVVARFVRSSNAPEWTVTNACDTATDPPITTIFLTNNETGQTFFTGNVNDAQDWIRRLN